MFNITGGEIIIVLVLALVVLGPDKLPGFIRSTGRLYSELRRMASGFKAEFDEAMAEPLREMRDTADMAKKWFDGSDDADDVADVDEVDDGEGLVVDEGVVVEDEFVGDELDPFAGDDDDDGDDEPTEAVQAITDDDEDDDEDGGDDPNFYDENGNLLDARAIAALIDDADTRGSGAAGT